VEKKKGVSVLPLILQKGGEKEKKRIYPSSFSGRKGEGGERGKREQQVISALRKNGKKEMNYPSYLLRREGDEREKRIRTLTCTRKNKLVPSINP